MAKKDSGNSKGKLGKNNKIKNRSIDLYKILQFLGVATLPAIIASVMYFINTVPSVLFLPPSSITEPFPCLNLRSSWWRKIAVFAKNQQKIRKCTAPIAYRGDLRTTYANVRVFEDGSDYEGFARTYLFLKGKSEHPIELAVFRDKDVLFYNQETQNLAMIGIKESTTGYPKASYLYTPDGNLQFIYIIEKETRHIPYQKVYIFSQNGEFQGYWDNEKFFKKDGTPGTFERIYK